jgi:hypothetical protein
VQASRQTASRENAGEVRIAPGKKCSDRVPPGNFCLASFYQSKGNPGDRLTEKQQAIWPILQTDHLLLAKQNHALKTSARRTMSAVRM